jgi:hypothetical protein
MPFMDLGQIQMKIALGGSVMLALALAGLTGLAACQKAASNAAASPAAVATNTPPAAAAAQPASTDSDDVKAFLDGLYAHYKTNSSNSTFQPFDANAGDVLDPDTIALMKADQTALKGELGDVESDWLCDCQDYTSIKATITVQSASATTAKATSEFHDVDDASPKPRRDTFDLVKTAAGWRIHDVGTEDQPSLRKVLRDEIAKLKTGGKPVNGPDEAP